MYLFAQRHFDNASIFDDAIKACPYDPENSQYYFGRWRSDSDTKRLADDIIELAGMTLMVGDESNSVTVTLTEDGGADVSLMVGYWRKANAIHSWFVENCQDGIDECQCSNVIDIEQLLFLRKTCEDAIDAYTTNDFDRAMKLMSPRPGFFFGGIEIDDAWLFDMQNTIHQIDRIAYTALAVGHVEFYYQSSW